MGAKIFLLRLVLVTVVQVGSVDVAVVDACVHMRVRMLANEKAILSVGMNMVFVRMGMAMFMFNALMYVGVLVVLPEHKPCTG